MSFEGLLPWRSFDRWECRRCGWCCCNYDVSVTVYDEERLRKYGDVFRRGKIGLYLKRVEGRCVFYEDGRCLIYDERPMACRNYPFYFFRRGEEGARFGNVYVYVDPNCKGFGGGRRIEEVIAELLEKRLSIFGGKGQRWITRKRSSSL